jgi:(1->4)-alpha-D-glucan 1-alpha-D-glucosylmutase
MQEWHERDPHSLALDLMANWRDGRIKLFLTWSALSFRRAQIDLFVRGSYQPLSAEGPAAEHVCALARSWGDEHMIAVAPRLVHKLHANQGTAERTGLWQPDAWRDSQLILPSGMPQRWRHRFTSEEFEAEPHDGGSRLDLSELFASFPVALLEAIG